MRIIRLFLILPFLHATSLLAAPPLRYHLTDLGVIPGQQMSVPNSLNQLGQAAGSSESFASRYNNGIQENLGTLPGGTSSVGVAINNSGVVAGYSTYQNSGAIRHATLFRDGAALDLGTMTDWGNYSFALGLNDANTVVGYSAISFSTSYARAFIWDASKGMRDLGTLGGQYAKAFSINNSSVVTGSSQTLEQFGAFHAFIWDAALGMRDLGTLGGSTSSGRFINGNGHIVGTSTTGPLDNETHVFLYNGAAMQDLGAIGGVSSLNIRDEIVGSAYRAEAGALYQYAFIYRDGRSADLEPLVDLSGADYRLYSAVSINDAGQILVDATRISSNQRRSVLLTPVPEIVSISRSPAGRVILSGRGVPNQTYRLQSSAQVATGFTPLARTETAADGSWQTEDSSNAGAAPRFYRLVTP